jgi:hypothetical protein
MKAILFSLLVSLAVGLGVVWFMTRSYGGGDVTAARTACLSVNQYAKEIGFDARLEGLSAPPSTAPPTATPTLAELLKGARQPGGGGMTEMKRLETWCVGRGYGPTPTP